MTAITRGQLATLDCAGDSTLRDVYTVPAGRVADVNVIITNRSNTTTDLRAAHIKAGVSAAVANGDYMIYDLPTSALINNKAPIKYTGIIMGAGDTIAVYSSATAISVQVNGIEEDV